MTSASAQPPFELQRQYELNMPHMGLSGLSEGWLFRELGDMHWTLISRGLRAPSSQLSDANGARLYATFTRLRFESSQPLGTFAENDAMSARASIRRFGAGVFFGDISLESGEKQIRVNLMSSFTKRSSSSSNLSLLKGQPHVPADSPIPEIAELPSFAQEYRRLRALERNPPFFEYEYEILPYHDINGVGLLYFAAYPTINDLCEMRYFAGADWCLRSSTLSRDVHYYGNCDLHDRIVYRLHDRTSEGEKVTLTSSLSRASDGVVIAQMITTKRVLPEVGG